MTKSVMICPISAKKIISPCIRHSLGCVVDVNDVIESSAEKVFNVAAGRLTKLPATTAEADRPVFSNLLD